MDRVRTNRLNALCIHMITDALDRSSEKLILGRVRDTFGGLTTRFPWSGFGIPHEPRSEQRPHETLLRKGTGHLSQANRVIHQRGDSNSWRSALDGGFAVRPYPAAGYSRPEMGDVPVFVALTGDPAVSFVARRFPPFHGTTASGREIPAEAIASLAQ